MSRILILLACAMVCKTSYSQVNQECYRPVSTDVCPTPPPGCGNQACTRPEPVWIEKPGNSCIPIPTYDWSQACIDKREPIKMNDSEEDNCELVAPPQGNGYREYDDVAGPQEKLCWRMRKCANSCTELSGAIGTIDNRVAPGCDPTINPGTTNLFEARCNPGTTDGNDSSDIDGPMSEDWWNCKGMLSPCVEN